MLLQLDNGFAGVSIQYVNIVMGVSFIIFLLWRYLIEVQQMKNFLGNVAEQLDEVHSKNLVLSSFQKMYFNKLQDVFYAKDTALNESKIQLQEDTDDLLAWVHEVKTPLTAINLMLPQVEDVRVRRKLEHEWLRLYLLVDQQLHQTRLASIEKDNYMGEVELRPVVYGEIRAMQAWCLEKGIGFDVSDLNEQVMTDSKWLAFIIRQILSNAIKYSSMDSEVHIFTEIDSEGAILLHIKDEGIGIPKEDLPRIFQKSYTGTAGRESAQSTGMGLYLAYNIAQKIGIRIRVQSLVGKGSIFTLRFPLPNEYVKLTGR